eukprot:264604_1
MTLRNIESMDNLYVSPQSVITNQVIVRFNNNDITPNLSIMITDINNLHLLYNLVNNSVLFLSIYASINNEIILSSDTSIEKMIFFIEKVLYLSGLVSISTSIPTEIFNITFDNFQLFTIRNDDQQNILNVIINDIQLLLNTKNQTNSDIIIVGISVNSSSNVTYNDGSDNTNDCLSNTGTLSNDEISVTVLNASNYSSTEINITFDNIAETDSNTNAVCVWFNEKTQEWDSSGCSTIYSIEYKQIKCACNHLTTFGTIRGIQNKCNNLLTNFRGNKFFIFINAIFGILFISIVFWILFQILRLKYSYNVKVQQLFKETSIKIVSFVAFLSMIQCFMCFELYIISQQPILNNQIELNINNNNI